MSKALHIVVPLGITYADLPRIAGIILTLILKYFMNSEFTAGDVEGETQKGALRTT